MVTESEQFIIDLMRFAAGIDTEKRIKHEEDVDEVIAELTKGMEEMRESGEAPLDSAILYAQKGDVIPTAACLKLTPEVPKERRAEIMATSFTNMAENISSLAQVLKENLDEYNKLLLKANLCQSWAEAILRPYVGPLKPRPLDP